MELSDAKRMKQLEGETSKLERLLADAVEQLSAQIAVDRAEAEASRQGATWALHVQLQRGEPRCILEGDRFQDVR